jgi:hypothetical protein
MLLGPTRLIDQRPLLAPLRHADWLLDCPLIGAGPEVTGKVTRFIQNGRRRDLGGYPGRRLLIRTTATTITIRVRLQARRGGNSGAFHDEKT